MDNVVVGGGSKELELGGNLHTELHFALSSSRFVVATIRLWDMDEAAKVEVSDVMMVEGGGGFEHLILSDSCTVRDHLEGYSPGGRYRYPGSLPNWFVQR